MPRFQENTMSEVIFDVLIVGSGPSGVQACSEALAHQCLTGMVDIGFTPSSKHPPLPEMSFSQIRKNLSVAQQEQIFLGSSPEELVRDQDKAGAHLTPARQYMVKFSEKLFPHLSENFYALLSTSRGGLGVSWGSNAFLLSPEEAALVGIDDYQSLSTHYERVAESIGISGRNDDDGAPFMALQLKNIQSPLPIDDNSKSVLNSYEKKKSKWNQGGFFLGQSLLAVLTEQKGNRRPNPLYDLDFWGDLGESVYRPQFTLRDELIPNPLFRYLTHLYVVKFLEDPSKKLTTLYCRRVSSEDGSLHEEVLIQTRKLILCAGAISSARIALDSLSLYNTRLPLLCNPNRWVACLNWRMLGQKSTDRRYSLAQLTGFLSKSKKPNDLVLGQFYTYRSLLFFRIFEMIPLPSKLALLFLRVIANGFTMVNIHFPDSQSPTKWITSAKCEEDEHSSKLIIHYKNTHQEKKAVNRSSRSFLWALIRLGCFPMGVTQPMPGASIHYAGTLPYGEMTELDGQLKGTQSVYVADASVWKWLPSKGLTLTLMANARRTVAKLISKKDAN